MSRIPALNPEAMSAAQRAAYEEIINGPHGKVVGPYPVWLQSPELARRGRALSEVIRFNSSLPPRLMELSILLTGWHWKAEFEFYAHARLARKAGVDEAVIAAIAAGRRPAFQNADEEIVYDLSMESLEAKRVSDGTHARAVAAFGLPAVVELVATIGYYCMVCVTLNAFQVPLPDGVESPFPA